MNIGEFEFYTNSSQGRQQMQIHRMQQKRQTQQTQQTVIPPPRIPRALKMTGDFKFNKSLPRGRYQIQQEQLRQEQLRREQLRQEQQRQEQLRQEQLRQEQLRQEQLRQEQLRQEQLRQEQLRQKQLRQKQLRQEKLRQKKQRQEQLRQEKLRQEKLRQEKLRQEKLRQEQLRQEQLRRDNHLFLKAKIRLGVVITTNGFWGVLVRQCIECYTREFPEAFIVLFINESGDPITLGLEKEFSQIKVVYIKDQIKSGGLTSTWNAGIDMCMRANCNVIILSNDDIVFDSSVKNIVEYAYLTPRDKLQYYGPLTNNPGPAKCNKPQLSLKPQNRYNFSLKYKNRYSNLNGFMTVFPKHVLLANKFDDTYYFDPKYPFGGNETEWFNRFIKIGGQPIVVPRTFIYHYKIARWRENEQLNDTCIYTINTGGYEGDKINLTNISSIDSLYFTDNWKVIYNCIEQNIIPFYIDTKNKEAKLVQREIKTNVQNYLPYNYTRSLYVDGNLSITNYSLLEKYINERKYDIICFDHPVRKKVKNEMIEIIRLKLETQENIKKIYDEFAKHDFKDNIGLTETNCLIRNHKNIIDFNNDWCNKINICRRDQASFDFLLHKHKINYKRHLYNEKTKFTIKTNHINSKFRHVCN